MPPPLAPPTVRDLLRRPDLHLRLVGTDTADKRLDQPLQWVHSTDLLDPTPFLSTGLVLLTTGAQLSADDPVEHAAYVARLAGARVIALGFGTGLTHAQVPESLTRAAHEHGMPLIEVPRETPFIAVTRTGGDLVAAHGYARRTWELAAHRALAAAALQADGLGAALAELSRRLGCWVGVCDAAGDLVRSHPRALGEEVTQQVEQHARSLLGRATRAAVSILAGERQFTLQTLGRPGQLRGVLVLDAESLDAAGRGVVATVVAMAGFVGDEAAAAARARDRLRTAALAALLAGNLDLARQVADAALGGLPDEPVRVAVTDAGAAQSRALRGYLDVHDEGERFFGEVEGWLVLLVPADDTHQITDLAARFERPFGVSRPASYQQIALALPEAVSARQRGRSAVTAIEEVSAGGVLATLGREAAVAARAALEPLETYDRRHGTQLLHTVTAWLENEAQHEATARALGVHRHTVRTRIALAERVLHRDLSTFPARAELWAAVVASSADRSRGIS